MAQQDYGGLKGDSIGLAGGDISPPHTPPTLQSPDTPLSPNPSDIPDTPMSPITTAIATSSTPVPSNMKAKLMEFCSKNKLPLPDFKRRQGTVQGAYTTELSWTPAGTEDDEGRHVINATKQTKKDAENTAAAELFPQIREYISSNKQVEMGNSKGDLQQLITKHNPRLGVPNYKTEPTGISFFSCTLCVVDSLTGEKYTTSGKGIGKKTAEKEASSIMLVKLTEVLSCCPTGEMAAIDKLEFRLKQFPAYSIGWVEVENGDSRCFLRTKGLVLRKEGATDIILGYCSGATQEEAAERCAQNIVPHLDKLEDFLSRIGQEQPEEAK